MVNFSGEPKAFIVLPKEHFSKFFWWTKSFHDNFMGILYYQGTLFFAHFLFYRRKLHFPSLFSKSIFILSFPTGPISMDQSALSRETSKALEMWRWEGRWRDKHVLTHFLIHMLNEACHISKTSRMCVDDELEIFPWDCLGCFVLKMYFFI